MAKYDEILTAKAWIIMNFKTGAYMRGSNVHVKRQIASLTKMYTLYACLQINKQLNINAQGTYIKILNIMTSGSSAKLIGDRYISLNDLYYAMMLPSGNDAASQLAFYYGYWLDQAKSFPNLIFNKIRKIDLRDKLKYQNLYTQRFIQYLNQRVIKGQLNHQVTKLQNPHGLNDKYQVSTAWQLAEAAIHFMKNSKEFRKVVGTQKYSGFYLNEQTEQEGQPFGWQNTNALLKEEGFGGVKTGITSTAGGCLCTYKSVLIKNKYEYEFLTVVLGCQNAGKRFEETRILCNDLERHLEQITY